MGLRVPCHSNAATTSAAATALVAVPAGFLPGATFVGAIDAPGTACSAHSTTTNTSGASRSARVHAIAALVSSSHAIGDDGALSPVSLLYL